MTVKEKTVHELVSNIRTFIEILGKYSFNIPNLKKLTDWCVKNPEFVNEVEVRKAMISRKERILKFLDVIKEDINKIEF